VAACSSLWRVQNAPDELGHDAPMVTGVVGCNPVMRGPDVAPSRPWPHPGAAWQAPFRQ